MYEVWGIGLKWEMHIWDIITLKSNKDEDE